MAPRPLLPAAAPALVALALVALAPASAAARPGDLRLGPRAMARLGRGEVVAFSQRVRGSGVLLGTAIAIVDDTPEATLFTLLDLQRYPEYVPRIDACRIVRDRGRVIDATLDVDLPWPVSDAHLLVRYVITPRPGRSYAVRWRMLRGNMIRYEGQALVEPLTPAARRSALTFRLLAEPDTFVPDALVSYGLRRLVEVFVDRQRQRVRLLRRRGEIPPRRVILARLRRRR